MPGDPPGDLPSDLIVARAKGWYEQGMEELFGHPAYTRFVLQDVKRLPARFFARLAGARLARTS